MKYPIPPSWKPMKLKVTKEMKVEAQKDWDMLRKVMEEFQRKTSLPKDWRGRLIKGEV